MLHLRGINTIDDLMLYINRKTRSNKLEKELYEIFSDDIYNVLIYSYVEELKFVLRSDSNVPSAHDLIIIKKINKLPFLTSEAKYILEIYKNRKV